VVAGDAPLEDAARGGPDCPTAGRVTEVGATIEARMLHVLSLLCILAAVGGCDYSKLDGIGPGTAAAAMQKVEATLSVLLVSTVAHRAAVDAVMLICNPVARLLPSSLTGREASETGLSLGAAPMEGLKEP
jgi:hypothetical protein